LRIDGEYDVEMGLRKVTRIAGRRWRGGSSDVGGGRTDVGQDMLEQHIDGVAP